MINFVGQVDLSYFLKLNFRFDSPNPVQSVTPTPTPPPQRQPTPQSSTSLQQQPPTPLQPPPPQDSTFSQNRYGNQPPSMMTQGPQPHMGGPPHDAYTHNYPHQQGYSTPNKMMGGPPEQYGGFPSQYQNFPNQRPTMRNDMGMYGTPSKRFPDQYPNQGERQSRCLNLYYGHLMALDLLCLVYCQFLRSLKYYREKI